MSLLNGLDALNGLESSKSYSSIFFDLNLLTIKNPAMATTTRPPPPPI